MGLYEVPLSMSLLGFVVKSSFKHTREEYVVQEGLCV